MSAEPKGWARNRLLYDGECASHGGQCARRVRDDDFSSTTYKDWTLRKERSLLSASAYLTCLGGALGMLAAAVV